MNEKLEKLDIIIPVYNEGDNIVPVLTLLKDFVKTTYQIFICYDSDDDNTLQALAGHPELLAKVIPVKNKGRGVLQAVQSGIAASNASAVLVFPADDKFNAKIIDSMVELFDSGCDIVAASRFIKGGCMVGCPWIKAMLVRTSAFVLYYVANLPTRDPSSGFRLFSRRLLNRVTIEAKEGWSFSLELLVKCHRLGWRVGEVPALWYERMSGQSRFRVFKWLPGYLKWFFYAFQTKFLGATDV